ncbi:MAG TPA: hypothetical protein VFF56_00605 [Bacillota bacterium]|jgi:cell division protein FtsL|nr:hypothetical protein [Bacillota bacterium]
MRKYEHGNLALKAEPSPQHYPSPLTEPFPYPDYETLRREKEEKRRRLQYSNNVYVAYKQSTRARARHMFSLVLVVLLAALVLGISVWRYAQIVELNFSNVRLTRQIKELEKENSLIRNEISNKMSLEEIKENASTEIGLQKANSEQIIQLNFSAVDKIVFAGEAAQENMEYGFAVNTIEEWVTEQRGLP